MAGCSLLAHVASPFPDTPMTDAQMAAAIVGTAKVLRAAKAAGIERVVVTASTATISGNQPEGSVKGTTRDNAFTSDDWTPLEGLDGNAYSRSKVEAEKAAWAVASELGLHLDTVHPSFTQGALLLPRHDFTSVHLCRRVLTGAMPAVVPLGFAISSVVDVADVHIAALMRKNVAGGGRRYIVVSGNILLSELARKAKDAHPSLPIKTLEMPWIALRLYACIDHQAKVTLGQWRLERFHDSTAATELLGRELQDPYAACLEMAASLVKLGVVDVP